MTIDLTTRYLGMTLRTPLVASASPLSEDIDKIRRLEDAGAAAIVLYSLFEEQLRHEQKALEHYLTSGTDSYAEALSYFPETQDFVIGPEEYLEHIRRAKQAVGIPVIASLNGTSLGDWTHYARQMQQAGADAVELNVYYIPTDGSLTSERVEQTYLDVVASVKSCITIPLAVKIGPFFTNMASMAQRLCDVGADGLVLFNRFYQPDIDLDRLEVEPTVMLSTPFALRLPLRWIAILSGRIPADLAATSGVHQAEDVVKLLLVGANVTMMCSALLRFGIEHLRTVEVRLCGWLGEHEYESVQQLQGSMSQRHCADPAAFERANYMRALHSFRPGTAS
jgi:dihydroorotate dehydrogenase (fumarate)